jgi:restriction system protein
MRSTKMARKSEFEKLIDSLLQSAWWASFIVAVLAYTFFTFVIPGILDGSKLLVGVAGMSKSIAPYAAIFFCFIGGLAWFNVKRKAKLVDRQADINSIRSLSWKQFEELLGEIGRRKGYQVIENFGGGADGGVDVRFKKDGKLVLVQCKNWKAQKVNVKVVRELYGVMAAEGAHGGLVVTAGTYTQDALDFAKDKSIDLIGGQKLEKMVAEVRRGEGQFQTSRGPQVQPSQGGYETLAKSVKKSCPSCGSDMVKRVAKKGPNTGNQFWGCSTFPKCRAVENV